MTRVYTDEDFTRRLKDPRVAVPPFLNHLLYEDFTRRLKVHQVM